MQKFGPQDLTYFQKDTLEYPTKIGLDAIKRAEGREVLELVNAEV